MKLARLLGRHKGLSDFLDRFAANELDRLLAGIGRSRAVALEEFPSGGNALIRRLVLADGSSLVVRLYFVDPIRQKGLSHWHLNRRLRERGLRVPTIHIRQTFPFSRGLSDVDVLIEDFLEGEEINEAALNNRAVCSRLAEVLLRLHEDVSPSPGRTWTGKASDDPMREAVAEAPVPFERVRGHLPEITSEHVRHHLAWLRECVAKRSVPTSYELVHGDFYPENLLLTPDGAIALIDLGAMAYGCFETDLVAARQSAPQANWWKEFCDEYFAARPSVRERFEQNAPLFFAVQCLSKAAHRATRARKALEKGKHENAERDRARAREYWKMLATAVENNSPR
ncbi:phosphotransferase [Candidatus Sumerlaeota bacterium]|nr:phosphotransferase [Candidatus Sumerlaeota bacterium]